MTPHMTPNEIVLLSSFLLNSRNYLEFGSGGSTVLASTLVQEKVTTLDSDKAWLERVGLECKKCSSSVVPTLNFVDIGSTGPWGFPANEASRNLWPDYHQVVWQNKSMVTPDLCLVDGRFRVACFLQSLLHISATTTIMMHDYIDREHYHVIERFSRRIASVDTLCVFQPLPSMKRDDVARLLMNYAFDAS